MMARVGSGGEGHVAGAGEDGHPQLIVLLEVVEGVEDLFGGFVVDGVAALRSVDGDVGQAAFLFVEDVLEACRGLVEPIGHGLLLRQVNGRCAG